MSVAKPCLHSSGQYLCLRQRERERERERGMVRLLEVNGHDSSPYNLSLSLSLSDIHSSTDHDFVTVKKISMRKQFCCCSSTRQRSPSVHSFVSFLSFLLFFSYLLIFLCLLLYLPIYLPICSFIPLQGPMTQTN